MAAPSLTYSLTNGSTADAAQVMQNLNDLLNGITDGTKDLTIEAFTAEGATSLQGNVTLGNSTSDDLTVTANLASTIGVKTTYSYDIGTSTIGLRSIYFGDAGASTPTTRLIGADIASSWTLTLPTAVPSQTGMGLISDTNGTTSWRYPDKTASKTTTYTATGDETTILADATSASFTITLPAAASFTGKRYVIKKTDSSVNTVTIDANGTETIDGELTFPLYTQLETVEIVCDGSNWHIVNHKCTTEPTAYTPTITGCGTVASLDAKWWRTGGFVNIAVSFECGTVAASTASFTYPAVVLSSGIAKIGAFGSRAPVGTCHFTNAGGGSGVFTSSGGCAVIIAEDVSTTLGYFCVTNSTDAGTVVFSAQNGSTIFTTGANVSFYARIPVLNWKE